MRKLLNPKYSKIYLSLFVIITVFRYIKFLFNLDIIYFPINLIRGVFFLCYYLSLVKKNNILFSVFLILSFISSETAAFKLHVIYISLVFLARVTLFIHLYKTINWARIRNTIYLNTLIFSAVLILFVSLFYMLFLNNANFHKNNIGYDLASLFNEMILVIICVLCFVNFLHKQTKINQFIFVATSLNVIADILYNMKTLVPECMTIMVIIASILYIISAYLLVKSQETIVKVIK